MSEDFNEIIDFTIYEFLFDLKKETNYTSLGSLCNNLKYCFEFNTKLSNESFNGIKVTSPIIGTAYQAPEPGAKKFAEVV